LRIATTILALLMFFPFVAQAGAVEDPITVTSHDDRLTIRATDASLTDIFGRLSEVAEISVHLSGLRDARVTTKLEGVEIEEAVRQLLKPHNSAIVFKRNCDKRISSIDIYVYEFPRGRRLESASRSFDPPAETEPSQAEQHFAAEAAKIDRVTDLVRDGKRRPQSLLGDPDPSVRITALQSCSGKNELVEALGDALTDNDDLVQATARQMLLDRGAPDDVIDTLASLERSGRRVEASLRLANLAEHW
jgi:hypothetical protein